MSWSVSMSASTALQAFFFLMLLSTQCFGNDQRPLPKPCVVAMGTNGLLFVLSSGLNSMIGSALSDYLEVDLIHTDVSVTNSTSIADARVLSAQLTYFPFIKNLRAGRVSPTKFYEIHPENIDKGLFFRAGPSHQNLNFTARCNFGSTCSPRIKSWEVTSAGLEFSAGALAYNENWIFEVQPLVLYKGISEWSGDVGDDHTMKVRILDFRAGYSF